MTDWGDCPLHLSWNPDNNGSNYRCTSSGYDQKFRPVPVVGDVNGDDAFAVAFICKDAGASHRAAGIQSSVEVVLGWTDNGKGNSRMGATSWGACPDQSRSVNTGNDRCVSSAADGRFHSLPTGGDVGSDDALGIMLQARPLFRFIWPDLNLYEVLIPTDPGGWQVLEVPLLELERTGPVPAATPTPIRTKERRAPKEVPMRKRGGR